MSDYLTTNVELTSIADAIREKGGTNAALVYPQGFIDAIEAIPQGVDLPVFTVTVDVNDTVQSITCDKTYAQCYQLLENEATMGAVVRFHPNYPSSDYDYGISHGGIDYDSGYYALYGPVFIAGALYDIKYRSNGSIELVSPSEWSGEEGTPVATKGAVSNHSIAVTPSVVNTGGFISGNATITGTPVTVSASELVSGTKSITSNGTGINVTDYAAVDVNVPQGSVSSVTIIPAMGNQTFNANDGTIVMQVICGFASSVQTNTITIASIKKIGNLTANKAYHIKGSFKRIAVGKSYSIDTDFVYSSNVRVNWTEDGTQNTIEMSFANYQETFSCIFHISGASSSDTQNIWADFIVTDGVPYDGFSSVELANIISPFYSVLTRTYVGVFSCSTKFDSTQQSNKNVVGAYAFAACGNLSQVHLNAVGIIREYAFYNCTWLNSAYLPSAVSFGSFAFGNCRSLVSVYAPEVTYVGSNCFNNCSNLSFISLPNASRFLDSVFFGCSKLESIYAPNINSIGVQAFFNCSKLLTIDIPNVSRIQSSAFQHCYSLSTVTNTSSLESLGFSAFYSCYNLLGFSADNVTYIGANAFQYCSALSYAYFSNATSALTTAFTGCVNLVDVSMPKLQNLGVAAFSGCTGLSRISLPSVTVIGANAFQSCSALEGVSFPAVTSIGDAAFSECTNFSYAYFNNLTTVGGYVFASCHALTDVRLPKAQVIVARAFRNCSSLSQLVLPAASQIQTSAFHSCYHLLSLYLLSASVCALAAANAFTSTPISNYTTSTGGVYGSIFVPASLYSSYINATNWKTYSARIVSLTDAEIASILS